MKFYQKINQKINHDEMEKRAWVGAALTAASIAAPLIGKAIKGGARMLGKAFGKKPNPNTFNSIRKPINNFRSMM